ELCDIATRPFSWYDIGFPPDGAAYARTNPFLPYAPAYRTNITFLSPRFFRFYEAGRYHRLRRNKYQLHFAYLQTGDVLSPLDFISLAASPYSIKESVQKYEAL